MSRYRNNLVSNNFSIKACLLGILLIFVLLAGCSKKPDSADPEAGQRLFGVTYQTMNNPFFVDLDEGIRQVVEAPVQDADLVLCQVASDNVEAFIKYLNGEDVPKKNFIPCAHYMEPRKRKFLTVQSDFCKIIDVVRRKLCSVNVYPVRGSLCLREPR